MKKSVLLIVLFACMFVLLAGPVSAGGEAWNKWQPFVNGVPGESKYAADRWLIKDFGVTHYDYEIYLYANDETTFLTDYLPGCEASPFFLYWGSNNATIMKTLTGRDVVNELYGGEDPLVHGCVFSPGYHESQP